MSCELWHVQTNPCRAGLSLLLWNTQIFQLPVISSYVKGSLCITNRSKFGGWTSQVGLFSFTQSPDKINSHAWVGGQCFWSPNRSHSKPQVYPGVRFNPPPLMTRGLVSYPTVASEVFGLISRSTDSWATVGLTCTSTTLIRVFLHWWHLEKFFILSLALHLNLKKYIFSSVYSKREVHICSLRHILRPKLELIF